MYLYTNSKGILARKSNIEPMLGYPLHHMKGVISFSKNDVLVGWGQKANTRQIKLQAQDLRPALLATGRWLYRLYRPSGQRRQGSVPYRRPRRYLLRCPPAQPARATDRHSL